MLERGIVVSYETIRLWCRTYGARLTGQLCRKTPSANDVWRLDEVVVLIGSKKYLLWCAANQDGYAR